MEEVEEAKIFLMKMNQIFRSKGQEDMDLGMVENILLDVIIVKDLGSML